ncbi:MAG: hypothetical protein V7717_01750 [Porticoccaceae bacterium]
MELSEAVKQDIERGRKVSAIKRLRRETGMGLRQAKDIIDAYGRGPAYQGDSEAALSHRHGEGAEHADTDAQLRSTRNNRVVAMGSTSFVGSLIKFVIVAGVVYFLLKNFF